MNRASRLIPAGAVISAGASSNRRRASARKARIGARRKRQRLSSSSCFGIIRSPYAVAWSRFRCATVFMSPSTCANPSSMTSDGFQRISLFNRLASSLPEHRCTRRAKSFHLRQAAGSSGAFSRLTVCDQTMQMSPAVIPAGDRSACVPCRNMAAARARARRLFARQNRRAQASSPVRPPWFIRTRRV